MPAHRCVEEIGSTAMLAAERSAGVAPQVNIKERVTPLPSTNKTTPSGFETQRRRYQKSRTGVSVVSQKGPMSLKNSFKKFHYVARTGHKECERKSVVSRKPQCKDVYRRRIEIPQRAHN